MSDRELNEECAVVGIFGNENASKLAYFSLFSMQHRGQEAAGITTSDGKKLHTIKDRGLVTSIFNEDILDKIRQTVGSVYRPQRLKIGVGKPTLRYISHFKFFSRFLRMFVNFPCMYNLISHPSEREYR